MPNGGDNDHDRITRLEEREKQRDEMMTSINEKLTMLLGMSAKRDVEVATIKSKVIEMAPSVQVVRDGLIFVKWGRWLVAGAITVGVGLFTSWQWIHDHIIVPLQSASPPRH